MQFLDIGSGVGGVCLLAAVIGGAEATGIEIRRDLHEASMEWHRLSAAAIPSMANALQRQSQRLINQDATSHVSCAQAIQNADVIFINNKCFDDHSSTQPQSLNSRLAFTLQHHMKLGACCITTAPVATTDGELTQAETFPLPSGSVSWTLREHFAYLTCRRVK